MALALGVGGMVDVEDMLGVVMEWWWVMSEVDRGRVYFAVGWHWRVL